MFPLPGWLWDVHLGLAVGVCPPQAFPWKLLALPGAKRRCNPFVPVGFQGRCPWAEGPGVGLLGFGK